jgi:hypothetical protein
MKTCKDCQHWTQNPDKPGEGQCNSPKFVEADSPPLDGLAYTDYEGYNAYLSTGPDFGCIHHEARKP